MEKPLINCSLCGAPIPNPFDLPHPGNNPEPLKPYEERCCDNCNSSRVIPARIAHMRLMREGSN